MAWYTLDTMDELHVGIEHEEKNYLQVLKRRNDFEDFGQALVFKDEEENLDMGEIYKGMSFK